jgi:hypothetical protein
MTDRATATALGHPVALCYPWCGGNKVERSGPVERASDPGVEAVMLGRGLGVEQHRYGIDPLDQVSDD